MAHVLEAGHVYFFYRPRVEQAHAEGLQDVQRFHCVLSPRREGETLRRVLTIGRKRLPQVQQDGGERAWAFVDRVVRAPGDVEEQLAGHTYETKTRGERHLPEARPAGEGVYAIVDHEGHTHFAYELEFPKERGDVQQELNIARAASYVVVVKNPAAPSPPKAGLAPDQKAELPRALRERFHGKRFVELKPDLLDREGTELVLIAASSKPEEELGIHLEPLEESEAEAAIFRDLELHRSQYPVEPLFTGDWR
jgi:hypothetical protein